MMSKSVDKKFLEGKVENFIAEMLQKARYEISLIDSVKLLNHNRFDLGLKLAYLKHKSVNPNFAIDIYHHDIRSQTLGKFEEYGNFEKNSFDIYLRNFDSTFNDIKENGYDEDRTIVPLSLEGCILNGAHRVASAIFLGEPVVCVKTELDNVSPNFQYFIDRNVPEDILDIGAVSFSDYADNVYMAFLWPSGRENYNQTELLFPNIVYKKKIKLSANGGLQLLIELYKHMDWLGSARDNFPGARKKLLECFTDFESFTVVLFQSESIEKVKDIKQKIRDINKIGFSSVHITDTKEEVNRISRLVFNKNGLHFLNYARPYKFKSTQEIIKNLQLLSVDHLQRTVLDGSTVLSLYGLREARDIDYISDTTIDFPDSKFDIEAHDSQLKYHNVRKEDLIYNANYNFMYCGIKFVGFSQTYQFKKSRNEEKDIYDCGMMSSLIEKKSIGFWVANLRQKIFYRNLIAKSMLKNFSFKILKVTGTYVIVRSVYRKFKNLK